MLVNEIFFSLQGEGPQLGLPAWFIRFSGCNLNCKWCDSKYAKKGKVMSIKEIVDSIETIENLSTNETCKNIIITGGEPLFQKDLLNLIKSFVDKNFYIETNGTIFNSNLIGYAKFIVSPKLQYIDAKYLKALRKWSKHSSFKFVIQDKYDFKKAIVICKYLQKFDDVYFMPMGTNSSILTKRMKLMAVWIKRLGWGQLTPRLQIQLWGNRRKV